MKILTDGIVRVDVILFKCDFSHEKIKAKIKLKLSKRKTEKRL